MSSFREVQLTGYEILNAVVDLCEKHNITYYLGWGTLLGAIRHEGFIPWDDDIDIEMPVEDYRRFLRIARKELPEDLFLQTYFTDSGYNEMWAKVRKNDTASIPLIWKDLDIHWGIGIDIFPMVGVYQNVLLRKLQMKMYAICRMLIGKDMLVAMKSNELANPKLRMFYLLPRACRIAFCRVLEQFVFKGTKGSDSITSACMSVNNIVEKKSLGNGKLKRFESREFRIPDDYHSILEKRYGDYMTPPPESERNGHEGSLGKIICDCEKSYKEYTGRC